MNFRERLKSFVATAATLSVTGCIPQCGVQEPICAPDEENYGTEAVPCCFVSGEDVYPVLDYNGLVNSTCPDQIGTCIRQDENSEWDCSYL